MSFGANACALACGDPLVGVDSQAFERGEGREDISISTRVLRNRECRRTDAVFVSSWKCVWE